MNQKTMQGWFPEDNQKVLEELIKKHDIKTVLEIGTFVGMSAIWFAKRVQKVVTVDPFDAISRIDYLRNEWKEVAENQFDNCMKNIHESGCKNIEVIKATSEEARKIITARGESFDLIYIDGSHEEEDVALDIGMWLQSAKIILCGDDYSECWPGVRNAVDHIPARYNVNKEHRCWYVTK